VRNLSVRKIMDVLRLKEAGFSQRQIAESLACARSTVGDTLSRAAATTLTYEEAQELDDAALQARVYPGNSGSPRRRTEPDYEYLHRELRRPGVTLQRLCRLCRYRHNRHTHATQLLKAGVHPKVVSERLGHASISITLDTYSHVMPGMQEEAAEKIDAGLRAALAG